MLSILCVIGGFWIAGSVLFVLALAAAAHKTAPTAEREAVVLKHAA